MSVKKYSLWILSGLIFFSFPGCSDSDQIQIAIDDAIIPHADAAKTQIPRRLILALGAMTTPKQAYGYYYELAHYLEKKLDLSITVIDKESYSEVNRLLKEGKIDLAFVCGRPYIDGHEEFGLKLLVVPQINGTVHYHSYIIVHKDSATRKLDELKGRRFAFSDPLSNSGCLIPTYLIVKIFGVPPEKFFQELVYSGSHDKSIAMVAAKLVDAAAVDSLIWDYLNQFDPQDTAKTKILATSKPYSTVPVVVRPNLNPQLEAKIRETFLAIHQDNAGREILKNMRIDRFVEVDDSMYNDLREVKSYLAKNGSWR
ncbi:MAG: phosphate/phosphite/phosphonate ABC transporter substrate-binding protein [Candidatus Schekmanbacteria bacterium]|nr:phosphate/phosphite/phosphonate ABC transporter substrate-binding protein [Candidatus Schekmanbacteria bacterium]